MPDSRSPSLLHLLRSHPPLLGTALLLMSTLWLAAVLTQCLSSPAPGEWAPMAVSAPQGNVPCPQNLCQNLGNEQQLDADRAAVPITYKPSPGAVLFVAAVLLLPRPQKKIPIPPQPLLPGRPRTLKFYALRI